MIWVMKIKDNGRFHDSFVEFFSKKKNIQLQYKTLKISIRYNIPYSSNIKSSKLNISFHVLVQE